MDLMGEWHDYVRVLAFFVNIYALFILVGRFREGHDDWNTKTLDLWYALTFWTLAGVVFSVQGVVLDRPFTVGFVFLCAATFVAGKGVNSRGPWGGNA